MSLAYDTERRVLHEPHGWASTVTTTMLVNPRHLMECPCGWFGWIAESSLPLSAAEIDRRAAEDQLAQMAAYLAEVKTQAEAPLGDDDDDLAELH